MDLPPHLQMLKAGLAMGSLYGLVALGFVLNFNAVNVVTIKKRRNR
jgi:branched-subunit amino acid ABC-type transport system permease component